MENQTFDREFISEFQRQNVLENPPEHFKGKISPRPFWLSRWNYISISTGISLIAFFVTWGILNDNNIDAPWIPAGVLAATIWSAAISVREVLARRARMKYLLAKERANYRTPAFQRSATPKTLSLEENAAILKSIRRLAETSETANPESEKHLEVVRACHQYLEKIEQTLPSVHSGSPRLAALRNGQEKAKSLHHRHLLAWAADKSRNLAREAALRTKTSEKIEMAQKALVVLDSALEIYPNESQLTESAKFIREFISLTRVSHFTELAERSEFKGRYRRAVDCYRDALFYLNREGENLPEREIMIKKIENEVEKLRTKLREQKKSAKTITKDK